jgi:UDP-N-acetylmuramoyl-L-alanyl-D-glutamate--2,6-diaminopimelate ligase
MKLASLIRDALGIDASLLEAEVTGVAQDSRRVQPGFVFVARPGEATDGHRFVPMALARGAVAVVGEASEETRRAYSWHGQVPYVQVADAKLAVAKLAACFYGYPSQSLYTLGVTGTDGKTTTCFLLHHLLSGKYSTGLLSTAGIRAKGEEVGLEGHFTTPEAPQVQSLLARFRDAGCMCAVLESSSHGFAQQRLAEVNYNIGVWTNLTPEHLDYHKTFEAYREAKLTLMRRAEVSVLNADDPSFEIFAQTSKRVVSYGVESPEVNWSASEVEVHSGYLRWKLTVNLDGDMTETTATLPMVGAYNVSNALAALAAAHEAGVDIHLLLTRLATFPGVPGRMQLVQREPFAVVVDFAHTAPALAKALAALKVQGRGRLLVVIGAAGERDPGKRAPLGEAATKHAEIAIFTEEDCRSEDVNGILRQMQTGAEAAGGQMNETFFLIPDRREAIRKAVAMAQMGDTVLLAGKGHETTLEREGEVLEWNEAQEAKKALAASGKQLGEG